MPPNNRYCPKDMKLLPLAKRLRAALRGLASTAGGASELMAGATIALWTGRTAPKVAAEERAKESLIICPSPMLNQHAVNLAARGRYTISFVNSASLSPAFLTLRPERFFLIDPAFYRDLTEGRRLETTKAEIEQTLALIANATDWPMTVVVPWHYQNSPAARRLRSNPNIAIFGLPVFDARSRSRTLKKWGLGVGILNPVYRNVLIAAVFYSLKAGHKRTILWGAHHTWLKDVEVDNKNRVLHSIRHTEGQQVGIPLLDMDGAPRPYHDYLHQLAIVFEQYHVLQAYAAAHGQEILNATADSFIDAFPRIDGVALLSLSGNAANECDGIGLRSDPLPDRLATEPQMTEHSAPAATMEG